MWDIECVPRQDGRKGEGGLRHAQESWAYSYPRRAGLQRNVEALADKSQPMLSFTVLLTPQIVALEEVRRCHGEQERFPHVRDKSQVRQVLACGDGDGDGDG